MIESKTKKVLTGKHVSLVSLVGQKFNNINSLFKFLSFFFYFSLLSNKRLKYRKLWQEKMAQFELKSNKNLIALQNDGPVPAVQNLLIFIKH